ncbi:RNA polymerase sigma factor [Virgibacillus flavescens]|uniref:RNA polymerase sigma factor n=1 Tax=Virgibacillus flavescens TaxID=1611422 RepID=UPI003D32841F
MKDNKKIALWFKQYHDDILNFLVYYTGKVDVDDLVQEVFIKAVRNVNTFKGNSEPKTWLISIARNVAIDEMRKRKRESVKRDQAVQYKKVEHSPKNSPEELFGLNS